MARMSEDELRAIADGEMRRRITAEDLRALVSYDPATGVFVRLTNTTRQKAGDVAGSVRADGYVRFRVNSVECLAHRLAWLYVYGEWPKQHLDHIDGNPSNNAIANLRQADNALNMQNQRKPQRGSQSGLLGVSIHKKTGLWRARICTRGQAKTIGYFRDKDEAFSAYLAEKKAAHPYGEIARQVA